MNPFLTTIYTGDVKSFLLKFIKYRYVRYNATDCIVLETSSAGTLTLLNNNRINHINWDNPNVTYPPTVLDAIYEYIREQKMKVDLAYKK